MFFDIQDLISLLVLLKKNLGYFNIEKKFDDIISKIDDDEELVKLL